MELKKIINVMYDDGRFDEMAITNSSICEFISRLHMERYHGVEEVTYTQLWNDCKGSMWGADLDYTSFTILVREVAKDIESRYKKACVTPNGITFTNTENVKRNSYVNVNDRVKAFKKDRKQYSALDLENMLLEASIIRVKDNARGEIVEFEIQQSKTVIARVKFNDVVTKIGAAAFGKSLRFEDEFYTPVLEALIDAYSKDQYTKGRAIEVQRIIDGVNKGNKYDRLHLLLVDSYVRFIKNLVCRGHYPFDTLADNAVRDLLVQRFGRYSYRQMVQKAFQIVCSMDNQMLKRGENVFAMVCNYIPKYECVNCERELQLSDSLNRFIDDYEMDSSLLYVSMDTIRRGVLLGRREREID